ncbi:PaaI family thioesterase [Roseomonas sp. USHLN139]|uniref:PaaI family thioesterase n=1 Tax=Roseomonas sp. USHLN139 TaxID=3081298 RepID=UPI003B026319
MSKTDLASPPPPYHELLGIRLTEWRDGYARVVCDSGAGHLNRSGIVHGGVILSLIDQAGAFAGLWCSIEGNIRKAVTIDLDCRFTGQVAGGEIVAIGQVISRGRNIFFARTEVFDAAGKMVAFGASTHRWRAGSEGVEGSPA